MHKKKINNSLTKNFIQGLRPLSNTLPTQIKKVLKKNGFNLSSIVDNWTGIVGNEVSNKCYPVNIKSHRGTKSITLILNVIHGKEIDVEYNKKNIIDKINSYFGYSFIERVELKIVDTKQNVNEKKNSDDKTKNDFDLSLYKIKNFDLKTKLERLINAYNKKK